MREKPNEWVAIADLMSGVVAVVMLLLVMSVVQNKVAEARHKQDLEQGADAKRAQVARILGDMSKAFALQGNESMVKIDIDAGKITLRETVFERGSACITSQAKGAFAEVQGEIADYFAKVKEGQIFIEGHSDNSPVARPVTDYRYACTVYDDNFTLSAARAREARRLMIGKLDSGTARRVVVAGYGDSQPLPGIGPENAANRRVEVRFGP